MTYSPVGDEVARERGAAAAPSGSRHAPRVLVVEDNPDYASMLAEILEMTGRETCAVRDGPAALAAAPDYQPDVVLLDIGLPGMDGYEVARRLRAQARARPMVLVAVSGYGQEEDRQRSREAGMDYHLTKPVEVEDLERVLEAAEEAQAPALSAPSAR